MSRKPNGVDRIGLCIFAWCELASARCSELHVGYDVELAQCRLTLDKSPYNGSSGEFHGKRTASLLLFLDLIKWSRCWHL